MTVIHALHSRIGRDEVRRIVSWLTIDATAAVLLLGRYDWTDGVRRYAWRGWSLSLYMCVLVVPVAYYLLRVLTGSTAIARAFAAFGFVILTVPYRWLGLDQHYYYAGRPTPWYSPPAEVPWPRTAFLPDGPLSTFNHDIAFFAGTAVLTVITAFIWCRLRQAPRTEERRRIAGGTGLVLLVLVQSLLHSGVRAPYVYATHWEGPPRESQWFAVSHFQDGAGASNADQSVFSAVEQIFHGVALDPLNMLMRRPTSFYLAAQASYFINSYHAWIVLNVVLWVAAVFAGYGFARRLAGRRAASFFATLIATGPGFVMFVGTPAMYLAGFAVVIFALYLLERLLVDSRPGTSQFALFSAALGLCALTYDLSVLFPVLAAYGIVRGIRWRPLLAAILGALVAYRGYLFVHNVLLGLEIDPRNSAQTRFARERVVEVLQHPDLWLGAIEESVGGYIDLLWTIFFGVPVLLALAGIVWVRNRESRVLVGGMVAMTFATSAFFRIGDQVIGWLPRFTYPAYPGIYLLASIALATMASGEAPRGGAPPAGIQHVMGDPERQSRFGLTRAVTPWLVVALITTLSNIDSFGYPHLYYQAVEGTDMGALLRVSITGDIERFSKP